MSISQRINGWLRKVPAWPLYVLLPIPGIWVFYLALTNQLGPDPLITLERELGETGLQLIILTLVITPLRRLTKVSLLKFRRALGVMAFFYVFAHMLSWALIDLRLDIGAIFTEIVKRPFITIGMLGFLTLIPLAVTSNNLSVRRLGAAVWTRIHKLAYLAAALGALHYLLVVKAWPPEPIVYASIVATLLGIRAWWAANKPAKRKRQA